jgi:hypothetical protein
MTTNVIQSERDGKEFCDEVYSQERKDHRTRSHLSNVQHDKLGDAPWHPTGHIKLSVCTPSNFVFSTILLLHKLGASMFSFYVFV